MVRVLDHYPFLSGYDYRNTVREGFQVGDYPLNPDECVPVRQAFAFETVDLENAPNIKIIAFAQEPNDHSPAEVYQVGSTWPFRVFADGFESGDLSAWSATVP